MKAITKYQAADGTEFAGEVECVKHEALCAEIAAVMSLLPPSPKDDGCDFANGHGYIQHDPTRFQAAREALLKIANRISPHRWFDQALADPVGVHASWPGRMIDEISRPLSRAWYRVMCTDKELREWGQPYYADHPQEAERYFQINVGAAKAKGQA